MLERLKPFLRALAWSQDEYDATIRKVDEFGSGNGLGPVLQQRLEEHAVGKRHWLEEWWDDLAYLTYRDSVSSPEI